MKRYVRLFSCAVLILVTCSGAQSQKFRVGAGAQSAAYTLDVRFLGRDKQSGNSDGFALLLVAEVDLSTALATGIGLRTRDGRYFTRQVDLAGNDVGWINSHFSEEPYIQTHVHSGEGIEMPLYARYRFGDGPLVPYVAGEIKIGWLDNSGEAYAYRVTYGQQGTQYSDMKIAEVATTITGMSLGAGMDVRITPWFGFQAGISWRHTFTTLVDTDFIHVHERDTVEGKIVLLFAL